VAPYFQDFWFFACVVVLLGLISRIVQLSVVVVVVQQSCFGRN